MRIFKFFQKKKEGIFLSQYSDLPRYYTIDGKKYDIDKVSDVQSLPMFVMTFDIWGCQYTMDKLLLEHAMQAKLSNYSLYAAAITKSKEYTRHIDLHNQSLIKWQTAYPQNHTDSITDSKKQNNQIDKFNLSKQIAPARKVVLSCDIDSMDGSQFEQWCAELLRKSGFSNVRNTGKSGDQGVDILASKDGIKYAIQCKCYSSDLGNKPIQEVYAGKNFYNCHVGAVMTNRCFTSGGRQLAESTGVLLWDRRWIDDAAEKCGMCEEQIEVNSRSRFTYSEDLLPAAVDIILETRQASVSILQRRLNLGYAHAARMIDEMEALGFVGPFQGSKPRNILITKHQWENMR